MKNEAQQHLGLRDLFGYAEVLGLARGDYPVGLLVHRQTTLGAARLAGLLLLVVGVQSFCQTGCHRPCAGPCPCSFPYLWTARQWACHRAFHLHERPGSPPPCANCCHKRSSRYQRHPCPCSCRRGGRRPSQIYLRVLLDRHLQLLPRVVLPTHEQEGPAVVEDHPGAAEARGSWRHYSQPGPHAGWPHRTSSATPRHIPGGLDLRRSKNDSSNRGRKRRRIRKSGTTALAWRRMSSRGSRRSGAPARRPAETLHWRTALQRELV